MRIRIDSRDKKYFYGKAVATDKLCRFKVKKELEPFLVKNLFKVVDLKFEDITMIKAGEGDRIYRKE